MNPGGVKVVAAAALVLSAAACSSGSGSGSGKSPAASGSSTRLPTASSSAPISTSGGGIAPSTSTAENGALRRSIPVPWDRPAYQDLQVAAAGLQLTSSETLTVHYHAHVDVLVYGSAVPVPAELGINVGPNDTAPPHGSAGIAPLHTHDETGVVHIEAPASATFTLGQVFTEWGVELATGQVGNYRTGDAAGDRVQVYVNGHEVTTDPNAIVLHAHDEIAVVVSNPAHPNPSVPSSHSFPAGE